MRKLEELKARLNAAEAVYAAAYAVRTAAAADADAARTATYAAYAAYQEELSKQQITTT